ncbi:MAG TPA: MerR family transcriptional regulator [Actinomycetota bacterium]|nr:MerR family transcriptional regulator [Actinomycetota bacterium]
MRYRVDELASRAGVSVDTVRFYQARGLLPQPERDGRVAWYGEAHLDTLRRIRDLKEKGFTLASIGRLLAGDLDAADQALVAALETPAAGAADGDGFLSLDELAARTGVSPALLQAIEREGLLVPRATDEGPVYTDDDAAAVTAGLQLLEAGLPLGELLALAREHDAAMRPVAERAVDLFVRFVRDPIRGGAPSEEEAADRLTEAFAKMLPATGALVGSHFRRLLIAEAQRRIETAASQ